LEEIDNGQESVSVTTAVNIFEDVTAVEETFEVSIIEDKEEAMAMKTTTNQSEIEVITQQTTFVESNEASGATTEEDTVDEDPMLERTTIKVDHEDLTTTEIVTTFEASPDHTTTTEYPNEEINAEQVTTPNEEGTSTVTEDPVEGTTDDISFTEVLGTNEFAKTAERKEEDHVFTTNKESTEKPTTVKDETVEVTTPETEPRDLSTERAFADLPPTASKDEVLTNQSSPEQPNTSEPVDEQPETFTTTPEEISTTTDSNSEELSITEVVPEETTTFDDMVREIPSEEEVFNQDSFDIEIETTTMAFDEVAATGTSTEAFEAKTTGTTTSVTNENEGDLSTDSEITTDFQTTPGQLKKQPKTVGTPVGETTMIDVVTEKLLPEEVENIDVTQTRHDSEGVINADTATEGITEDKTSEPIMEETIALDALLQEDTTINNRPGESTTRDEVTTQASSTVVMTHTYVMQERKKENDDFSNEIPVDAQPEMKGDASSKLLDLVTQNFSEADNIIFDTEEIAPVKAPEDGIAERTTDPSFLDRIQEERIRDQETEDGTSYRTEKSISKVVTEINI